MTPTDKDMVERLARIEEQNRTIFVRLEAIDNQNCKISEALVGDGKQSLGLSGRVLNCENNIKGIQADMANAERLAEKNNSAKISWIAIIISALTAFAAWFKQ